MPRMDNPPASQTVVKLLAIGDGKVGKTHYAAMAAKAGFRVLYLDGDVGAQTISHMVQTGELTKEEASRIYLLDIGDTIAGGMRDTKFVEFMNEFTSMATVRWNDTQQRLAKRSDTADEIWVIKPALMGPNDLIVMDSWTGYTESVMLWCGRANSVDIANASTTEMRPVYQGGGLKTTEMLQIIRSSPTNWIVLGHPDEYTHTTKPEGRKVGDTNEKDLVIDWTKMIAKSTSKPQGLQMPKYFTDVGWLELSPSGRERRLNFRPKNDRVGGGHFTESKTTDEYSFVNLVKEIGGASPDPDAPMPWLEIVPPGESVEAPARVLDGTKATAVKGLAGLAKKATAPA